MVHDTNMVPINYLSISITRYCFLPSLPHRFTFGHSGLTRMLYHISYYMETAHYEQRDCCHKILFYFARHQYVFYYLLLNTK